MGVDLIKENKCKRLMNYFCCRAFSYFNDFLFCFLFCLFVVVFVVLFFVLLNCYVLFC